MKKVTSKKMVLLLSLMGTLAGVILLELSLQFFSLLIAIQRNVPNDVFDTNTIRILTLGESTTDALYSEGGKNSWPTHLERILNEKYPQKRFVVINKGTAAISSSLILKNLPGYLEKWKPHLIITMMGINDHFSMEYFKKESFIDNFILFKIFQWYQRTKDLVPLKTMTDQKLIKEFEWALSQSFDITAPPLSPQVVEWIKKNPEHKWFALKKTTKYYYYIWGRLPIAEQQNISLKSLFPLISESVKLNPLDPISVELLIYIGAHNYPEETRKLLIYAIESGLEPSDQILTTLRVVFPEKDLKLLSLVERMGYKSSNKLPLLILIENYRKLFELVELSNSQLAVMSYPTTNINLFKSFFTEGVSYKAPSIHKNLYADIPQITLNSPFNKIIFLDNSNFPQNNKEGYFVDRFVDTPKGGFGHTTTKGHKKIAENAYRGLKDWLDKITAKENH